jgi:type IV secretory pathway TraG/TraD family ATPase VirD4
VVFAHQALGDIEALGESVSNAILTNSNVKVFMRGNDPKSAEHFSKIIGTKQATKTTERRKISLLGNQGTGDVSSREVEEFVVHPNCFKKDLGVGEAIMIIPHDQGSKSLRIKFDRFPDITSCPLPDSIPGTQEGFEILDDPLTELPSNKKRELT